MWIAIGILSFGFILYVSQFLTVKFKYKEKCLYSFYLVFYNNLLNSVIIVIVDVLQIVVCKGNTVF